MGMDDQTRSHRVGGDVPQDEMTPCEFFGTMAVAVAAILGAALLDNSVLRALCVFAAILASNYAGWRGNR